MFGFPQMVPTLIPDFVKFGHVVLKLGTQSKENTYIRTSAHTHSMIIS